MQFSIEQKRAIEHGDGPAIVVAGPGSGKTAVITHRIKHLITHLDVLPEHILVITFSKAASLEMQNRFYDLCEDTYYPVRFGTFHSVFFHILNVEYGYNTSNIATLSQKRKMVRQTLRQLELVTECEDELVDSIIKDISFYKNSDETVTVTPDNNLTEEQFMLIYRTYLEVQKSYGLIDFEDMMLIVKNMFIKYPAKLDAYQNEFRYILIDEYQDINTVSFEVIRLLAAKYRNLYAVGDDDQSIYKFRAADVHKLLAFTEEYPDAARINLSVNYRSTDRIIDAAAKVISQNKVRFRKNIVGSGRTGDEVSILAYKTAVEEQQAICSLVLDMGKNGLSTVAVFLRTNREASFYAEVLRRAGINVNMTEKPFNPYATTVFKDFVHYINLAEERQRLQSVHLFPVMNKPVRYLSRRLLHEGEITWDELDNVYRDKLYMRRIIGEFKYNIKSMEHMDLYSRINYIRHGIGYDEYMKEYYSGNMNAYNDYLDLAQQIQESSRAFTSLEEMLDYAAEYERLMMLEDKNDNGVGKDAVNIMTFHASKGLEFDNVLIPHVNEGSVPGKRCVGEDNLEEERRMFYVAMTRAKNRLVITYIKGDKDKPYLPSRFLYPLLKK